MTPGRSSFRLRDLALIIALIIAGALPVLQAATTPSAPTTSPAFSAEAVKAAYIVNFLRFTKWPEATPPAEESPYVIGVVGNRELEDILVTLADRQTVHERKLRILRIRSVRDLADCHLVFLESEIPASANSEITTAECLDAVRGRPVLTVSNSPDFIANGGIINLYRDRENLRFEISPAHAAQAGLVMSSRLLGLARIVNTP